MVYRRMLVFCLSLFLLLIGGCTDLQEMGAIEKSRMVLARREKEIEELEEVRGSLKRIVNRKIHAVKLLEKANRLLGKKYMELGSYNLAEEVLLEAEVLSPYNSFIKKDLGYCYYFLGLSAVEEAEGRLFFEKSRKYFQAALEIEPESIEARYGLSLLLFFGFDDVYGAIKEVKTILSYRPDHVDSHFALGRFYYEVGELRKAMGEYITLTRILPKNSEKLKKAEENILRINRKLRINE